MLLSFLVIGIVTTNILAHGAVVPASDVVVVSRAVNVTIPSPPPAFTTLVGTTDVSTVGPESDVTFSTGVITAIIAQNAVITGAICTSSAGALCIGAIAYTILFSFWSIYATSNPTTPTAASTPKRAASEPILMIHSQFSATPSCNLACQLKAGTVEGTWTSFANMTFVDGTVHDVHFSYSGSIMGVKAIDHVYHTSTSTKRQEYDDDDGTVGAYYWEDTNEQAWYDWQSSGIQVDADIIGPFVYDNEAEIICADLEDQDGAINAGVMTWGVNNDLIEQIPADLAETLAYCLAGDPDVP